MDQQDAALLRASSGGSFNNAHNVILNQPTFIDVNHTNDKDSMDLLLSSTILGAEYDSFERYPPPSCHPGTRLDISGSIISWMRDPARIYKTTWLHGPAGVGKSAVIQTLAESEADSQNSILGATLFFSRPAERNDPHRVFNTIAYQLAVKYQPYRQYVVGLLTADSRVVKKSLVEQFKRFIVKPFAEQRLLEGETILITLDGLDECDGESAQREIISLITKLSIQHPNTPLIWIITSRLEPHLSAAFSCQDTQGGFMEIHMPINSSQACFDVEHFLRDKFAEIRKNYSTSFSSDQQWPTETQLVKVAIRASGLFVFADTVVRFVEDAEYSNPVAQLQKFTDILDNCLVVGAQENPFFALDALYTRILSGVPLRVLPTTRKLLTLLTIGNIGEFATACNILGISQADAYSALRRLHSVVKVPPLEDAGSQSLGVLHTSFADFLQSSARSGSFWIDPLETERLWFTSCTRVLSETHNIVESIVRTSSINISWPHLDSVKHVHGSVFYSALMYILRSLPKQSEHIGKLDNFFQDIDYAHFRLLISGTFTMMMTLSSFFQPQLVSYFEGLGIFTTIPLRSFNLGSIIPNGISYITSDVRNSLPGQEALKWNPHVMPWFLFKKIFQPLPNRLVESHWWYEEVVLSDDPGWTAHVHQHLTSMIDLLPSHPVRLLGKGQKTCAVITFDILDRLWLYVLPYRQS